MAKKECKYGKCSSCGKTIRLKPKIDYNLKNRENYYHEYFCKACENGSVERKEYEEDRLLYEVFMDEY